MGDMPEVFHGSDADGNDVTYADDGKGDYYISDGHKDDSNFWGTKEAKGHDHGDNKGGYNDRGQYTG